MAINFFFFQKFYNLSNILVIKAIQKMKLLNWMSMEDVVEPSI